MSVNFSKPAPADCFPIALALPDHGGALAPAAACRGMSNLRIVGLRDRGCAARVAVLQRWLPTTSAHFFDHDDSHVLSQLNGPLDMLLLHGLDVDRMARIVKVWRKALPSKLIVVASPTVSSISCSLLLNSGADAALELDTPDELASSWLKALLDRQSVRQSALTGRSAAALAARVIDAPPHQRKLLDLLLENEQSVVGYAALLAALGKPNTPESRTALRVAICKVREKVKDTFRIFNVPGEGYGLSALRHPAAQ